MQSQNYQEVKILKILEKEIEKFKRILKLGWLKMEYNQCKKILVNNSKFDDFMLHIVFWERVGLYETDNNAIFVFDPSSRM